MGISCTAKADKAIFFTNKKAFTYPTPYHKRMARISTLTITRIHFYCDKTHLFFLRISYLNICVYKKRPTERTLYDCSL